MVTQIERIASMEVRLEKLEEKVDSMDRKLDDLLALRYKGQGAFWLASGLFGTSLAAFFIQILHWIGGK